MLKRIVCSKKDQHRSKKKVEKEMYIISLLHFIQYIQMRNNVVRTPPFLMQIGKASENICREKTRVTVILARFVDQPNHAVSVGGRG